MTRVALAPLSLVLLLAFASGFASQGSPALADEASRTVVKTGNIPRELLDGPLADVEEIIFAVRISGRDHWYANFGYYSDKRASGASQSFGPYPDGETLRCYDHGGRLCRLNFRTGELKVLLDDPDGGVRDPQMHYDGEKILFSYRKGLSPAYHLYEINIDGTGLRQLTDGPDDDIEPTYLPDGGIMFCSSRCRRFVNCWSVRVATLYRCDGDGGNIRMLSSNNEQENTPWVLPDGRILYMRWEYIDRSQVHFHHLWTVNPDGTRQQIFYGNEHGGTVMLDAKPIPGTSLVVASFSPGHGLPEHMGSVTVVDPRMGPDVLEAARTISKPWQLFRDPYPISAECFLVADRKGLHVMDGQGNTHQFYTLPPGDRYMECHEPRALRGRSREPILSSQIDMTKATGQLFLADVYTGRNMVGVERGDIKKLLVLEVLPEPVHYSGGMEPITAGGSFTLSRVLGTVPVEEDGSAFMELPAMRSLYFVALDENDMSVKRMQSFLTLQPGELTGCVGCHESRSLTAPTTVSMSALEHRARRITPIDDVPEVLDYPRDIQPILDKHCVGCHDSAENESGVDLGGDRTPNYSISYLTMFERGMVSDGRNLPYSNRAPRSIGSSASRLMEFIDGRHHDVKVSELERKTVRLWIDTSATYPGTYAALGTGMVRVHFPIRMLVERCGGCHVTNPKQRSSSKPLLDFETTCNLSRPARSKLLRAPLAKSAGGLGKCGEEVFADTDDPCYRGILRAVEAAGERLNEEKRFDMTGFRPDVAYVREMKRFGILPADVKPDDPIDVYQTDRDYWRSFWYVPEPTETEPATEPEQLDRRDFPPFDPRNPFRRRGM